MKKLVRATTALIAVFTLVSGCTAPAPSASPTPSAAKQVRALWRVPVNLVGVPQVVGNTIVSYFRVKNRLLVGAWDLANGRLLWNARATTSGETPGTRLDIETITVKEKTYVAYLINAKQSTWPLLVIADARTGTPRVRAFPAWPSTSPRSCSDGLAFCFLGYRPAAPRKQVNLRVNPLRPTLATDRSDALPTNSRLLAFDIFVTEDRPPKGVEKIGKVKDSKVAWQRPYQDVFGDGASSDEGWALRKVEGNVIAAIGFPDLCTYTTRKGTDYKTCDDTQGRMVGLNYDTGGTVWSLHGIDVCPNTSILDASHEDRIIVCRNTAGSRTYVDKGGWWRLQHSTRQTQLIAVKHQTGEVLWHTDLGTQTGTDERTCFISSGDHLLLKLNGKTTSYDLSTGTGTPAAASSNLMCNREKPELSLYRLGEDDLSEYNIGEDVEPCDGTGKAIKTIAAEWVPEAGIEAGEDRWLMATPGAMTLVTLS